ncbi:MAG: apolipoprotein N-acyltransferase [Propionibacteriaceae bacterium]|nr:apolipoprotein N-acyltransferase [Propionibacteriaceae bacterium]
MTACLTQLTAAPASPRALVPEWPRGLRFVVALAMGSLAGLAFEPTNLWPLLFLGIAGWLLLFDPRLRPTGRGFGLGYGFGLGLNAVALNWLAVLVEGAGPFLAAALIAFMSLFFGLLGMAVRWVRPLRWWPLAVGPVWGTLEFVYSRVPFGGFGWLRLPYAQVDAPLAGLLPIVGVMGVTVLSATLAAALAALIARLWANPRGWTGPVTIAVGLLIGAAGVTSAGRAYQPESPAGHGTVTVGMVQGNVDGGAGVGAMGRARSVTNNHLGETITLMARARSGAVPMPDFVLWPENSTDIDPERDAQTRATVDAAVQLAGRPVLVGAVTQGPGTDERQTTALWWDPRTGVTDRYHKRNLVPFGEYIPLRDVLLPRIPLLELVGAQSVPGTTPGVLTGTLNDGRTIRVGDVICFELAYDATVHEAVRGSEVLVVQSNNATYRGTPQIPQQFAITRVRAMEARREIVVATTNAESGYIGADGHILDRTEIGTAASGSYEVPLRSALTPAVRFAGAYDLLTVAGAGVALILAGWMRVRAARMLGDGSRMGQNRALTARDRAASDDVRKK